MDAISQIKQNLDIVDVIQGYVSLKKSGRNYKGVCPFHSEKTPSFMVSQDLQIFKCFGCGAAGDVFKFVEQIEGVEFGRALEILAEKAGVQLERKDYDPQSQIKKQLYFINETTAKFYHYLLTKHALGKPGLDYIKTKRQLTDETIDKFMLGYAPDTWDTLYKFMIGKGFKAEDLELAGVVVPRQSGQSGGFIDKFRGRIVFPFTEVDGKVLGFTGRTIFDKEPKYLNTAETPVFHKSSFIYALDKARVEIKHSGAIFVEGQMDTISAHQAGIINVVASTGTSLTDNQLRVISRYTKDIVFCFDSDNAGVNAVYRAVEMAEHQGYNIKIAVIPKPFKDIDELINKDAKLAKKVLTEDTVSAYDFFLATALKRHDKASAMGKKYIMDELTPIFSKITNSVLIDHYTKKIAEELGLAEETVSAALKSPTSRDGKTAKSSEATFENSSRDLPSEESMETTYSVQNPEYYFVALLLKSNLDIMRKIGYNTQAEEFQNSSIREILSVVLESLNKTDTSLNISSLALQMSPATAQLFTEMCLVDSDLADDPEKLEKELNQALLRVKTDFIRNKLKKLSEEIKLAEMANDSGKVLELTKNFEELSKSIMNQ